MPDNPSSDSPTVPPPKPEPVPGTVPKPEPLSASQSGAAEQAPVVPKPDAPVTAPPAKVEPAAPKPEPITTAQPPPSPPPNPLTKPAPASEAATLIPLAKPDAQTGGMISKPMPQPPAAPKSPPSSAAQKCSVCGNINRPGILVCENCGTNLATGREATVGTKEIGQQGKVSESQEAMINTAGTTRFEDNMMLRLEIEGAPTPIVIYPKSETSLGRRDPGTGVAPDIDLTAYAGYRKGVSRNHAMLRLRDKRLELYDLGSSNGTLINGVRLSAHQPHPLRDGDEVTLGKMVIRVLFQVRNRTRSLT